MFLHEITLWDNEQSLDNILATKNRGMISECHTFIPWESSFKRLLCNYFYNKFVVLRTFKSNVHYCLIKDNREVVNTMPYTFKFIWEHHSQLLLPPDCFNQSYDKKHIAFNKALTHIINHEEFIKCACDNVSSYPEWCELLKDVLKLGAD